MQSVNQHRRVAKFAAGLLAGNMPAFKPGGVILPHVCGIVFPVREIKVAAQNRVLLRVGIVVAPKVGITVPLVRRAKNDVKLVLFSFRFLLRDEIIAPELLDVGAAPTQVVGFRVIRKIVLVVSRVHLQRDAPLAHVALAKRLVRLRFRLGQSRQKQPGQNGDDGDHNQ